MPRFYLIVISMVVWVHFGFAQEATKIPKSSIKDIALDGEGSERMVVVSGIIRIYEDSIRKEPNNTKIRKRFVDFLLKNKQDVKALSELKKLKVMLPEDVDLGKMLTDLTLKLEGPAPNK